MVLKTLQNKKSQTFVGMLVFGIFLCLNFDDDTTKALKITQIGYKHAAINTGHFL